MKSGKNIQATEVEQLLDKYFDGTSTLEEEGTLRDYFTSATDIPTELKYAQAIFGYFAEAAAETGIPAVHPSKTLAGKQSLESKPDSRRIKRRRGLLYYLAGAATAAAIVTLVLILTPSGEGFLPHEETVYCYVNGQPITDPELALEYSRNAFTHISEAINGPLPDTPVFEAFEKLEHINKMENLLRKLGEE